MEEKLGAEEDRGLACPICGEEISLPDYFMPPPGHLAPEWLSRQQIPPFVWYTKDTVGLIYRCPRCGAEYEFALTEQENT